MGSAIANALLTQPKKVKLYISNPSKPKLKGNFTWSSDNTTTATKGEIIFVAVKPGIVESALRDISPRLDKNQILVSIAAGIPIKKISAWSADHSKIVRVMPNLPVQVFAGVSVWIAKGINSKEKNNIKALLQTLGHEIEVKKESMIDSATAASGGGPAYVAAFLESLANFAKKSGFSAIEARNLALTTLIGSAKYISETGIDFAELKNAVQTKGGTTEVGFKVLKSKKWQEILKKALTEATRHARKIAMLHTISAK